ncbi:type II secretion system protein GspD [Pseudothermotoga thermarum]|uniref:Type II and III secretion system protein n=1 Tax=Pseudothermotoga thermarum DSM 5069 TaxID=688269 RepID=F7YYD7_9THEM|nr:type II and III secretion system protein [Pseudothermotoga thermarum]AEH50961.1 type II and III secretion system protein [Pseudothermotoga thermarum DSM 5069]
MRKILGCLILIVFVVFASASQLTKIVPSFLPDAISFSIFVDKQLGRNDVVVDKNAAGSIVSLYLKDISAPSFYLPIAYGPVESLRVFEIQDGAMVLIHLLIPVEPSVEVLSNMVKVTFHCSSKKIDLVLTAETTLEMALKFLADELGLNIVVSENVKNQKLSLKLQQVLPEDALRNLLTTVRVQGEPLVYSYMPDGTLHIGTSGEIAARFGKFWGIYDVTDREKVAEKLQSMLSPVTFITSLPNKALLFVYGDVREQELISKIISLSPVVAMEEIAFTIPVENVVKMLESLKKIYSFDYTIIEGLNKVVLRADPKIVERIKGYIFEYQQRVQPIEKEKADQQKDTTVVEKRIWSLIYPQQAQVILKEFGVEMKQLPFGQVEVKGTVDLLNLVERILDDLGFFGIEQLSLRTISVPKSLEGIIVRILKDIFALEEPRLLVLEDRDFVKIVAFAPINYAETVVEFANKVIDLLAVTKKAEVFFLEDEETAKQVSQILNTIYGIESVYVQSVLKVEGSETDINKAKNFINFFAKKKLVRLANARFDDEIFQEVRELIENKYKVNLQANLKTLGKVILTSQSLEDIENAILEIEKIYEFISKLREKFVKIVPTIPGTDFEKLAGFLKQLEQIEIMQVMNAYVLAGSLEAVERAEKLIEQIRTLSVEHKDYLILTLHENLNKEEIRKMLEEFFDVKIALVGNVLIIHGTEENLEKSKLLVESVNETLVKTEQKTEAVRTVKIVPYDGSTPVDEFQEYLKTIGKNVEVKLFKTLELVGFVGLEDEVKEAIEEYIKVSQALVEKQKLQKQEKLEAEEKVKVIILENGNFSVKCSDVQLYEVIFKIASLLGKSIVYFDKPTELVTLDVKSISWENFTKMVEEYYGYRFAETQGITALIKPQPVVDKTFEETFIYTVPHNLANIKPIIEFYGGKVLIDPVKNLLIVTGLDKTKKEQVEALITNVSKPLPQVEIEARFVDRSIIDDLIRKHGLNLKLTDNGLNLNLDSSGKMELTTSVIGLLDYQRLLSLLPTGNVIISNEISDKATVESLLANPKIVTSSGQEARILIGERIRYYYVDPQGNLVGPETLDTGIELRITPFVRSDGTIDLKVFTKVSEPRYYPGVNVPGEITREAETRVILNNGDTLVIGGLMRDKKTEKTEKVPVLGDLPFIGTFFRSKTENYTKQELIIFITARVIEL